MENWKPSTADSDFREIFDMTASVRRQLSVVDEQLAKARKSAYLPVELPPETELEKEKRRLNEMSALERRLVHDKDRKQSQSTSSINRHISDQDFYRSHQIHHQSPPIDHRSTVGEIMDYQADQRPSNSQSQYRFGQHVNFADNRPDDRSIDRPSAHRMDYRSDSRPDQRSRRSSTSIAEQSRMYTVGEILGTRPSVSELEYELLHKSIDRRPRSASEIRRYDRSSDQPPNRSENRTSEHRRSTSSRIDGGFDRSTGIIAGANITTGMIDRRPIDDYRLSQLANLDRSSHPNLRFISTDRSVAIGHHHHRPSRSTDRARQISPIKARPESISIAQNIDKNTKSTTIRTRKKEIASATTSTSAEEIRIKKPRIFSHLKKSSKSDSVRQVENIGADSSSSDAMVRRMRKMWFVNADGEEGGPSLSLSSSSTAVASSSNPGGAQDKSAQRQSSVQSSVSAFSTSSPPTKLEKEQSISNGRVSNGQSTASTARNTEKSIDPRSADSANDVRTSSASSSTSKETTKDSAMTRDQNGHRQSPGSSSDEEQSDEEEIGRPASMNGKRKSDDEEDKDSMPSPKKLQRFVISPPRSRKSIGIGSKAIDRSPPKKAPIDRSPTKLSAAHLLFAKSLRRSTNQPKQSTVQHVDRPVRKPDDQPSTDQSGVRKSRSYDSSTIRAFIERKRRERQRQTSTNDRDQSADRSIDKKRTTTHSYGDEAMQEYMRKKKSGAELDRRRAAERMEAAKSEQLRRMRDILDEQQKRKRIPVADLIGDGAEEVINNGKVDGGEKTTRLARKEMVVEREKSIEDYERRVNAVRSRYNVDSDESIRPAPINTNVVSIARNGSSLANLSFEDRPPADRPSPIGEVNSAAAVAIVGASRNGGIIGAGTRGAASHDSRTRTAEPDEHNIINTMLRKHPYLRVTTLYMPGVPPSDRPQENGGDRTDQTQRPMNQQPSAIRSIDEDQRRIQSDGIDQARDQRNRSTDQDQRQHRPHADQSLIDRHRSRVINRPSIADHRRSQEQRERPANLDEDGLANLLKSPVSESGLSDVSSLTLSPPGHQQHNGRSIRSPHDDAERPRSMSSDGATEESPMQVGAITSPGPSHQISPHTASNLRIRASQNFLQALQYSVEQIEAVKDISSYVLADQDALASRNLIEAEIAARRWEEQERDLHMTAELQRMRAEMDRTAAAQDLRLANEMTDNQRRLMESIISTNQQLWDQQRLREENLAAATRNRSTTIHDRDGTQPYLDTAKLAAEVAASAATAATLAVLKQQQQHGRRSANGRASGSSSGATSSLSSAIGSSPTEQRPKSEKSMIGREGKSTSQEHHGSSQSTIRDRSSSRTITTDQPLKSIATDYSVSNADRSTQSIASDQSISTVKDQESPSSRIATEISSSKSSRMESSIRTEHYDSSSKARSDRTESIAEEDDGSAVDTARESSSVAEVLTTGGTSRTSSTIRSDVGTQTKDASAIRTTSAEPIRTDSSDRHQSSSINGARTSSDIPTIKSSNSTSTNTDEIRTEGNDLATSGSTTKPTTSSSRRSSVESEDARTSRSTSSSTKESVKYLGELRKHHQQNRSDVEDNFSFSMSDMSEQESRIQALKNNLNEKRRDAEKLKQECKRRMKANLENTEKSLRNQLKAYDSYIVNTEKQLNELERIDSKSTTTRPRTPPKILSPRASGSSDADVPSSPGRRSSNSSPRSARSSKFLRTAAAAYSTKDNGITSDLPSATSSTSKHGEIGASSSDKSESSVSQSTTPRTVASHSIPPLDDKAPSMGVWKEKEESQSQKDEKSDVDETVDEISEALDDDEIEAASIDKEDDDRKIGRDTTAAHDEIGHRSKTDGKEETSKDAFRFNLEMETEKEMEESRAPTFDGFDETFDIRNTASATIDRQLVKPSDQVSTEAKELSDRSTSSATKSDRGPSQESSSGSSTARDESDRESSSRTADEIESESMATPKAKSDDDEETPKSNGRRSTDQSSGLLHGSIDEKGESMKQRGSKLADLVINTILLETIEHCLFAWRDQIRKISAVKEVKLRSDDDRSIDESKDDEIDHSPVDCDRSIIDGRPDQHSAGSPGNIDFLKLPATPAERSPLDDHHQHRIEHSIHIDLSIDEPIYRPDQPITSITEAQKRRLADSIVEETITKYLDEAIQSILFATNKQPTVRRPSTLPLDDHHQKRIESESVISRKQFENIRKLVDDIDHGGIEDVSPSTSNSPRSSGRSPRTPPSDRFNEAFREPAKRKDEEAKVPSPRSHQQHPTDLIIEDDHEEWMDDDFGLGDNDEHRIATPSIVKKSVTSPRSTRVDLSKFTTDIFSAIPCTKLEIDSIVDVCAQFLDDQRRQSQSTASNDQSQSQKPRALYSIGKDENSDSAQFELTSNRESDRHFRDFLFDLCGEIVGEIYRDPAASSTIGTSDEANSRPTHLHGWKKRPRLRFSTYSKQRPRDLPQLQILLRQIVSEHLNLDPTDERVRRKFARQRQISRRKLERTDELLLAEIYEEEQDWTIYDEEEVKIKFQAADGIFESILNEAVEKVVRKK